MSVNKGDKVRLYVNMRESNEDKLVVKGFRPLLDNKSNENVSVSMSNLWNGGFILDKEGSFRCLAELFYYIIDFHDFIKQIIYMNIEIIEQIGEIFNLSEAKIKERDNLIDILNYHINHRYLDELLYDIEYKCAKPQLGNEL